MDVNYFVSHVVGREATPRHNQENSENTLRGCYDTMTLDTPSQENTKAPTSLRVGLHQPPIPSILVTCTRWAAQADVAILT